MSSFDSGAHAHSLQLLVQVLGDRDLLQLVLENLPLQDLCISAAVCRLWRDVTSDPSFWVDVNFEKSNVLATQVSLPPLPSPRELVMRHASVLSTPRDLAPLPGATCSGLPHIGGKQTWHLSFMGFG